MAIRKYYSTKFRSILAGIQDDGTITSGTAGEKNRWIIDGIPWEAMVVGTQTTVTPVMAGSNVEATSALDIKQTNTAGQGVVLCPFANHSRSPLAFTVGTSPAFFVRCKINVATVANALLYVGFKGTAQGGAMQALTATFADYTDKATIGLNGANISTVTALNNAADVTTDTTDDAANSTSLDLKVLVSAAGVVTYQHDDAAAGTLAAPTTTVAYTFDDTDIVVPFIHFAASGGAAGVSQLLEFECGLQ